MKRGDLNCLFTLEHLKSNPSCLIDKESKWLNPKSSAVDYFNGVINHSVPLNLLYLLGFLNPPFLDTHLDLALGASFRCVIKVSSFCSISYHNHHISMVYNKLKLRNYLTKELIK